MKATSGASAALTSGALGTIAKVQEKTKNIAMPATNHRAIAIPIHAHITTEGVVKSKGLNQTGVNETNDDKTEYSHEVPHRWLAAA